MPTGGYAPFGGCCTGGWRPGLALGADAAPDLGLGLDPVFHFVAGAKPRCLAR